VEFTYFLCFTGFHCRTVSNPTSRYGGMGSDVSPQTGSAMDYILNQIIPVLLLLL